MTHSIDDRETEVEFPILGLRFEPNLVQDIEGPQSWFTRKLLSSRGPLISDFVTHEADFEYSTFGIHVGQDDRLTFMGDRGQRLAGRFVDCRLGSPTLHRSVEFTFSPSLERHLVIPRGVAHTLDNLDGIVTRDEPIWFSGYNNPDWSIDNDLVSVPRDTPVNDFPIVRPNELRLPDKAHQFQSRLSQSLLENPKAYLARFRLRIGSELRYVAFEPKSWRQDDEQLAELLRHKGGSGVEAKRSRYALTGPRSYTLVPNTASCVCDVLLLPGQAAESSPTTFFLHARTRKWYTFLNEEGSDLRIDYVDCRQDSPHAGRGDQIRTRCDPRVSFMIEPGIAYSLNCASDALVRCEHEVFVAADEPRADLPPFGGDLAVLDRDAVGDTLISPPALRCPDEIVRKLARHEISSLVLT